jgi:hypothetical protein
LKPFFLANSKYSVAQTLKAGDRILNRERKTVQVKPAFTCSLFAADL